MAQYGALWDIEGSYLGTGAQQTGIMLIIRHGGHAGQGRHTGELYRCAGGRGGESLSPGSSVPSLGN